MPFIKPRPRERVKARAPPSEGCVEPAGARVMLMRDGEPTSRFQLGILAFLGLGVMSIWSRVPCGFPQMAQGRVSPAAPAEAHPVQTLLGVTLASRGRSAPGPFCVPGTVVVLAILQGQGGPNPGPPELLLLLEEKGPPSCDLRTVSAPKKINRILLVRGLECISVGEGQRTQGKAFKEKTAASAEALTLEQMCLLEGQVEGQWLRGRRWSESRVGLEHGGSVSWARPPGALRGKGDGQRHMRHVICVL